MTQQLWARSTIRVALSWFLYWQTVNSSSGRIAWTSFWPSAILQVIWMLLPAVSLNNTRRSTPSGPCPTRSWPMCGTSGVSLMLTSLPQQKMPNCPHTSLHHWIQKLGGSTPCPFPGQICGSTPSPIPSDQASATPDPVNPVPGHPGSSSLAIPTHGSHSTSLVDDHPWMLHPSKPCLDSLDLGFPPPGSSVPHCACVEAIQSALIHDGYSLTVAGRIAFNIPQTLHPVCLWR